MATTGRRSQMAELAENSVGQAVCCAYTTRLAGEALRPPAAPLPSRGLSRPRAPTTRNPTRFLRPYPTLRGLDARQRCAPLHRQSGLRARHHDEGRSCPSTQTNPARIGCAATACPVASTVRPSRPTPRRNAFRLSTPDQPCADWMRGTGISRCIDIRGLSPKPRVSGFARRHPRPAPCRAGLAAGARPLHSVP
jgi:hypothetical protein